MLFRSACATGSPPSKAKAIIQELRKYDESLYQKPRWIVLNKLDMIPADERAARVASFVKRLRWKGPIFSISALTREGCEALTRAVYQHVAAMRRPVVEVPDPRFAESAAGAPRDGGPDA